MKKHIGGTGGGAASSLVLSNFEERVRILIGETSIKGHEDVPESVVCIENENITVLTLF